MDQAKKEDLKFLKGMKKEELMELCKKVGVKVNDKSTKKEMITWIIETVEDLSTWVEVKTDPKNEIFKKSAKNAGKRYKGKDPITGEKVYI